MIPQKIPNQINTDSDSSKDNLTQSKFRRRSHTIRQQSKGLKTEKSQVFPLDAESVVGSSSFVTNIFLDGKVKGPLRDQLNNRLSIQPAFVELPIEISTGLIASSTIDTCLEDQISRVNTKLNKVSQHNTDLLNLSEKIENQAQQIESGIIQTRKEMQSMKIPQSLATMLATLYFWIFSLISHTFGYITRSKSK